MPRPRPRLNLAQALSQTEFGIFAQLKTETSLCSVSMLKALLLLKSAHKDRGLLVADDNGEINNN